jgi:hypothetical protein
MLHAWAQSVELLATRSAAARTVARRAAGDWAGQASGSKAGEVVSTVLIAHRAAGLASTGAPSIAEMTETSAGTAAAGWRAHDANAIAARRGSADRTPCRMESRG